MGYSRCECIRVALEEVAPVLEGKRENKSGVKVTSILHKVSLINSDELETSHLEERTTSTGRPHHVGRLARHCKSFRRER